MSILLFVVVVSIKESTNGRVDTYATSLIQKMNCKAFSRKNETDVRSKEE